MFFLIFNSLIVYNFENYNDYTIINENIQKQLIIKKHDKWFAKDKFDHLSYSFALTGFSYYAYNKWLNNPDPGAKIFSISTVLSMGIGKEFYDRFIKKASFSYKDITADITGIALGILVFTTN